MEANVVIAVQPVDKTGYNVLPRVVLHVGKAAGPVNLPLHPAPRRQRTGKDMDNLLSSLPHIQHGDAAQKTVIRILSAPLGIKSRSVQHHLKTGFHRFTAQHPGQEFCHVAVLIIQFFRSHL